MPRAFEPSKYRINNLANNSRIRMFAFIAFLLTIFGVTNIYAGLVYEEDMLTPAYYLSENGDLFKDEVDSFLVVVRRCRFHHPLEDDNGQIPDYYIPIIGDFGAQKGPTGTAQHHPAIDLHVVGNETDVIVYASHDGLVSTVKDALKYRHYVSVTKDISNGSGELIGKLVTIYAHVDLDLDEADLLFMDGQTVSKGDIISRHLYANTVGGPHLHFETRYYRAGDSGDETFYGSIFPGVPSDLSEPSAGPWEYGYWDPNTGYGFGYPENHYLTETPQCGDQNYPYPRGDFTKDCYVNLDDLQLITFYWLDNCDQIDCEEIDLIDDGNITLQDFAELAYYWLECNDPNNELCTYSPI